MIRKVLFNFVLLLMTSITLNAAKVNVKFTGIQSPDNLSLTISSSEYLNSMLIDADGDYTFTDVPPGIHYVKAEGSGYNLMEALKVIVGNDGSVIPSEPLRIAVTKKNENPDEWNFSWYEDQTPGGYTTTSYVNKPSEIEFLGKLIVPSDVPSSHILLNQYKIILSDENECWSQEYAYRVLETIKTLPTRYEKLSKFTLTSDHIADDITIKDLGDVMEVLISKDAFYYANPFLVNLDGVRGRLFSKRLHHALTMFATDSGNNLEKVDEILWNQFGCHILGVNYEELTRGITNEDEGRFQMFAPSELVSIINMFEEMPEGFHKIPHLNYLIRRLNGHTHPIYPNAAAVTWPVENGYIEFMENAFMGGNSQDFETLRLILHEKTHMLWAFTFSENIKNDWIELGGWYQDPNSSDGWSTTKDTEFVTSYAHGKNPDEDMAESVAFYLKDPEALMSRSLPKYEFIRDRIMHGTRYISSIPDHLTFEVLNLWPDYDYPGKINSIDIKVTGKEDEDKYITIDVGLNHMEGYDDGATTAFTRINSPTFIDENGEEKGQFVDMWLNPVDGDFHHLRGVATISKYSKAGHWLPESIGLYDSQGNARYEGRNDCVTDIYINNPMEDLQPSTYVPESLEYELIPVNIDGHDCQKLIVRAKILDNIGVESVVTRIYADVPGFNEGGTGFTDSWGVYDPETNTASVEFIITEFYPTAEYYITFFSSYDYARTETYTRFSDSPEDQPIKKIFIKTANPDTQAPEIDLNRLFVYAEPTHPDAPDGETKVTVNFYARDDKSGFGPCRYEFRDPQGIMHGDWFYHDNQELFYKGDPTVWTHYQITHILPQGSVPGIWGLAMMYVGDHACNEYTYNFVETLIFEPDESGTDYVLFSELNDNILSLGLNGITGESFGFTWRVINEDTGEEINGASDDNAAKASMAANVKRVSANRTTDIDISALSDGNIVAIVSAFDSEGNVLTVKTAKVEKRSIVDADNVSLDITELTLNTGETAMLTAKLSPEETTDKTLTWSSSNEDVATVSDEGIITAVKVGTATITVSSVNGKSATCIVSVLQPAESIILDNTELTLEIGETAKLDATILPEDTTDKTLIWSSSDETVAYVDQEGVVTAKSEGNAVIKVTTINDVTAECIVTVLNSSSIDDIIIDSDKFDIYNMNGIMIKKNAVKEDLKRLPQGFYIIEGKKIFIR